MSDVGSVGEWVKVAEDEHDGCIPRFYMRETPNPVKSAQEGRACFDLREFVEIFIPGEKHNRPDRRVSDEDKERWPTAYAKFKETQEEVVGGTPINQWAYLNRAQVAELRAAGVLTVESLAAWPDGELRKLGPGGRDLQKRAKQHLSPPDTTEKELRGEIRTLKQNITELTARLENMKVKDDPEVDLHGRAQ